MPFADQHDRAYDRLVDLEYEHIMLPDDLGVVVKHGSGWSAHAGYVVSISSCNACGYLRGIFSPGGPNGWLVCTHDAVIDRARALATLGPSARFFFFPLHPLFVLMPRAAVRMPGSDFHDLMMLAGTLVQQIIERHAARLEPKQIEQRCQQHIEDPAEIEHGVFFPVLLSEVR